MLEFHNTGVCLQNRDSDGETEGPKDSLFFSLRISLCRVDSNGNRWRWNRVERKSRETRLEPAGYPRDLCVCSSKIARNRWKRTGRRNVLFTLVEPGERVTRVGASHLVRGAILAKPRPGLMEHDEPRNSLAQGRKRVKVKDNGTVRPRDDEKQTEMSFLLHLFAITFYDRCYSPGIIGDFN